MRSEAVLLVDHLGQRIVPSSCMMSCMTSLALKVGRPFPYTDEQVDEILALWDDGWPTARIAAKFDGWPSTIKTIIIRSGREWENRHQMERHYQWRGGRHVDSQGYVHVTVPYDWVYLEMARGRKRRVMEHRKVMAEHLGRALRDDETVHHINGDRQDNRIENLQLRSGNHGVGILMRCNHCGSHDVSPAPLPDGTHNE